PLACCTLFLLLASVGDRSGWGLSVPTITAVDPHLRFTVSHIERQFSQHHQSCISPLNRPMCWQEEAKKCVSTVPCPARKRQRCIGTETPCFWTRYEPGEQSKLYCVTMTGQD
ncbi:conserved hypothetical protein, partial [Trichinella spiralis]|uniref:hypothetical protein n=1 Tax=Trichinella spiralis TaxID=6334 RepID=UPI0001EFEDD6